MGESRKEYVRRYQQTENGKLAFARANKKYKQTDKGKLAAARGSKKYFKTDKGKKANRKAAKRIIAVKQALINSVKSKGCAKCGYNEHVVAIDMHHPDGKDRRGPLWSLSYEKLINELIQCVILCSNCHRIEHWG